MLNRVVVAASDHAAHTQTTAYLADIVLLTIFIVIVVMMLLVGLTAKNHRKVLHRKLQVATIVSLLMSSAYSLIEGFIVLGIRGDATASFQRFWYWWIFTNLALAGAAYLVFRKSSVQTDETMSDEPDKEPAE